MIEDVAYTRNTESGCNEALLMKPLKWYFDQIFTPWIFEYIT